MSDVPGVETPDAGALDVEVPEPVSLRQTVALNGASCDVRFGDDVIERFGRDLRLAVGRPGRCALLLEEGVDAGLALRVRRLVTDAGFLVTEVPLPEGEGAASVGILPWLYGELERIQVTGDDALVAVGGAQALSMAAFVAATWCGGTTLACIPTTMDALVRCPAKPLALDVAPSAAAMVSARPRMALCYAEPDAVGAARLDDAMLLSRALEVAASVCESKEAFNSLVLRTDELAALDPKAVGRQALDSARSIGRVSSSTALAVRQSLAYGQTFAEGLDELLGGSAPRWALLAEGMRFAARLAVGVVDGDVDFVFAQDALLDNLGLHAIACDVDAEKLEKAVKKAALKRSNRYLFALPYAVGRVRMTAVPDEVLKEHLAAWCATRAAL